MQDRPYQTRLFAAFREAVGVQKHKNILAVMPTGAGKGVCAARVMQMSAEKGHPSAFFAAQREWLYQAKKHLDRMGISNNVLMAGYENEFESIEDHVNSDLCHLIAKDTLWSRAFKSDKVQPPDAKILHIDECESAISTTYQAIADHYSDSISIGWTATPCRSDGRMLGEYYDVLIQGATYAELQRDGHLVPVSVISPSRADMTGVTVSGNGDWNQTQQEDRMKALSMVGSVVDEWKANSQGRSTVLFAAGVDHSVQMAAEFAKVLGKSKVAHIDGYTEDKERSDIIEMCNDGTIQVLCNYGVATTGVDVPRWKYMVNCRGTKSFRLHRQMGGRIQRPFGSEEAMIQDHTDNCSHFGHPDEDVAWSLGGDVLAENLPRTAKQSMPDEKPPSRCNKCGCEFRGGACPSCGHVPDAVRKQKEIDVKEGKLRELERKNRATEPGDKQKFWDKKCIGPVIGKNLPMQAALEIYRKEFGVYPRGLQDIPSASQIAMRGRDYYRSVVRPKREAAKEETRTLLKGMES